MQIKQHARASEAHQFVELRLSRREAKLLARKLMSQIDTKKELEPADSTSWFEIVIEGEKPASIIFNVDQ